MQVRVVGGDGLTATDAFNALLYRPPDAALSSYLSNNMEKVQNFVGGVADGFVNNTRAMYDKFNNSAILNASKALVYGLGRHTNQNMIMPISYEHIQSANLVMQQYIIANPVINNMVHDNMCTGFESSYFDMEPGITGTDRNDYRRVMDGALQFEKNGSAYVEQYTNGDVMEDLDSMDQFAIRDTWLNAERMIANKLDPTDPNRGTL